MPALCTLEDLLACLELEAKGGDRYTAPNLELPYYRIFGGQLLAQAIAIATHSTADATPPKRVKSLHVTFPRAGDLREAVEYTVEKQSDGRTFATRHIVATQANRPIFDALVTLDVEEPGGFEHQREGPHVPGPDGAAAAELSMIPWETRVVDGVDLTSDATGPPRLEFWQKAPALPDTTAVHQALFAHSTDLTVIGTLLRPHPDVSEAHSPDRIHTAVTTHTVWFHRPFRMDQWLLVEQEGPSLGGARGFGIGHAFAGDGALVASFAQESMIRIA
jgi:acyl-CoA thioesterase-2